MFTLAALESLLRWVRENFATYRLDQWQGEPGLVLRRDVDLDLEPALRLARLEADLGLRASYFVLVTSDLYNSFSSRGRALLREMADMGHEIGVHFDPSAYSTSGPSLGAQLRWEAEALSLAAQVRVSSFSLHNPSVSGVFDVPSPLRNAYDPAIFDPERYLSDSCRRFRHDPYDFLSRAQDQPVQLLIHPEHFQTADAGYAGVVEEYVDRCKSSIDAVLSVNPTYIAEKQRVLTQP